MNRHVAVIASIAVAVGACGTSQNPSTAIPSPVASSRPAQVSVLEGTWTSPTTTCAQQNDALVKAGFTDAQLAQGGWDQATCSDLMHGRRFAVRLAGEHLILFQDDVIGWGGRTSGFDDDSFEAGEHGDDYLTIGFRQAGDTATFEVLRDDYPTSSEAERLGDEIALTVVFESAPFTRESVASLDFSSSIYPYRLHMPAGWTALASEAGADTDAFEGRDGAITATVGTGVPEPGQTVQDRVDSNRAEQFAGCQTDPTTDEVSVLGGESAIIWHFACEGTEGLAVNTIHDGLGYRLTVRSATQDLAALRDALDILMLDFAFSG